MAAAALRTAGCNSETAEGEQRPEGCKPPVIVAENRTAKLAGSED
jgi:hypothetical protein